MQQVQLDQYGPPEVLHLVERPDPEPGPGQVVVRTEAAGITFVETQMRAGRSPRPGPPPQPPLVLGNGVEGTVVGVGPGVDQGWLGRRVVTATGGLGGYASHVAVASEDLIEVPRELVLGQAVALLADGRTALALMRAAAVTSSDRVLVTAAAGGVGTLLVQLATMAGACEVVAALGAAVQGGPPSGGGARGGAGRDKAALARELGADLVVDYRAAEWARTVGPVDVAFDGVGGAGGRQVFELVPAGGRFLSYGAAGGSMTDTSDAAVRGVTVIPGYRLVGSPEDNRVLVTAALTEAAAGRLKPVIGQTFPLAEAAAAHTAMEARATIGKTVLLPAPAPI